MARKQRDGMEARLDAAAAACMRQGAQLTELRRLVLSLILRADGPSTAYQLLDRLKETRRGAAPPTIYRALDFLIEQRLVHKIERLNAYVACTEADPHQHAVQFLICRNCGTVAEIEDRATATALERAAQREGFRPDRAMVELDGTCAVCWHP